jgi:Flp pilus assembly protein TadD
MRSKYLAAARSVVSYAGSAQEAQMLRARTLAVITLVAAGFSLTETASADTYQVILMGKVTMEDGSAPPFTVGIEQVCSDLQGSAPGPITNKKGEFIWRMEFDPFRSRSCYIQATHPGYTSSRQEISGINTTSHDPTFTLPTLILSPKILDPYVIEVSENNLPSKAKGPFRAAIKAVDAGNAAEAGRQLEAVAEAAPKSAQVWHALGIVDEQLQKPAEARKAYERAVQLDPKLLVAYVTLTRVCLKTKDWPSAAQTADALIKMDVKHYYPEIYLHRAVALYGVKDLAGAEESVQEAIRLDPAHKRPREEYVLGRILEAKGDFAGAREHISKYLELVPAPADGDLVQGHLKSIGKPEAKDLDPDLEPL